ncbi:hypothetical protein KUTeg_004735 [Tegillarca granosa]|uniref:Endonuclease/exonuclease/phosphatase domain-containing protein n=1 Tax=Tegillarca granosa TaxID=220873 RepID=A0ABQ9FJL1_TEGGR|nr:hypothetical protein KUTeg_004735 [Tegillarca granosa]
MIAWALENVAVVFITERFPWSLDFTEAQKSNNDVISHLKTVHLIYSGNDRHPTVKETTSGSHEFIIFGAIYRFILIWVKNQKYFIHNVTVSRYIHNYYIYSHSFYLVNENKTYKHYKNHSTSKHSSNDYKQKIFHFPSSCQLSNHQSPNLYLDKSQNSIGSCDFNSLMKGGENSQYELEATERNGDCCRMSKENRILNVMSYNVWNMNSMTKKDQDYVKRIKRVRQIIRKINPDIIGLQEVRYEHLKGGRLGPNQIGHLAKILPEYQFIFTPGQLQPNSLSEGRTEEGVALFSKYPMVSYHNILLFRNRSNSADLHQRVCQHIVIQHPVFGLINILNTHFSLSHEAREKSVVQIWRYIQKLTGPVIFLGDLNAEPQEKAIRFLRGEISLDDEYTFEFRDLWSYQHDDSETGQTYNALEETLKKRIDYIFMKNHKHLKLVNISVIDDGTRGLEAASDHVPLLAKFGVP